MAEQNEKTDTNVYEEMGDNRQPPNVYENFHVNSTSTKRVSPLDKGVSRRALLIGLLVPTLVALGAVCAIVALEYTQQARLEESVKDLAARVESLESNQQPQDEVKSVQLLRFQGELLQNLSNQLASLHTQVVSNSVSIQNLSDQMTSLQHLRTQMTFLQNLSNQMASEQELKTQEASLLVLQTEVAFLQNITKQDDCTDQPCANGGTCVDGINTFWCICGPLHWGETCVNGLVDMVDLTLEEHMSQITASRSLTANGRTYRPSLAVDGSLSSVWTPGTEYWTAWIQVDFVSTYTVRQVDIMLPCNSASQQPSSYRITFSDGSTQEVSKPCPPTCPRPSGVQFSESQGKQALYTLWQEPRRTSSVRLQPTARCDESRLYHRVYNLVIWGYRWTPPDTYV